MKGPETFKPGFAASGIGTLPHLDPVQGVALVLEYVDQVPYWPQLPARTPLEDMNSQYVPALHPLLKDQPETGDVRFNAGLGREQALAEFYERLFSGDLASFRLTTDRAAGFFAFCERVAAAPAEAYPWLKGQVSGPVTLASGVLGPDGKALLYDDEVAEALARGLGAAAAAQAEQLADLNRPVLIFIDEPSLSGFGSAFSPISRQRVIELLGYTVEEVRQRCPAVLGSHVCGNTDWSMIVDCGLEVLNLDSYEFGEHLLLYPEAVAAFYQRGGVVAWGAVPTLKFDGSQTADGLWQRLRGLLQRLEEMGLERSVLASQALVTPACGLGPLDVPRATAILELTRQVSELARAEYL